MEQVKDLLTYPAFWMATFTAIVLAVFITLIIRRIDFEKIFRSLTALLTFFLVIVGFWYTWETRGLRIQAENQLAEIREQFQLSIVPSLFPTIVDKDKVRELILEEKIRQTTGEVRYTKEQLADTLKYYVLLENVADIVAHDVRVYIFDSDTKSYLKSASGKAYVKPAKNEGIAFFSEKEAYINEEQFLKDVNSIYELNLKSLKDYQKTDKINTIFLFFNDIQGNTYLRTRDFAYDKQSNRIQGRTTLYELN